MMLVSLSSAPLLLAVFLAIATANGVVNCEQPRGPSLSSSLRGAAHERVPVGGCSLLDDGEFDSDAADNRYLQPRDGSRASSESESHFLESQSSVTDARSHLQPDPVFANAVLRSRRHAHELRVAPRLLSTSTVLMPPSRSSMVTSGSRLCYADASKLTVVPLSPLDPTTISIPPSAGTLTISNTTLRSVLVFSVGDGVEDATMTFTAASVDDVEAAIHGGLCFDADPGESPDPAQF